MYNFHWESSGYLYRERPLWSGLYQAMYQNPADYFQVDLTLILAWCCWLLPLFYHDANGLPSSHHCDDVFCRKERFGLLAYVVKTSSWFMAGLPNVFHWLRCHLLIRGRIVPLGIPLLQNKVKTLLETAWGDPGQTGLLWLVGTKTVYYYLFIMWQSPRNAICFPHRGRRSLSSAELLSILWASKSHPSTRLGCLKNEILGATAVRGNC